jgi:hypothetical protein
MHTELEFHNKSGSVLILLLIYLQVFFSLE